jgi:hypothetical protein
MVRPGGAEQSGIMSLMRCTAASPQVVATRPVHRNGLVPEDYSIRKYRLKPENGTFITALF